MKVEKRKLYPYEKVLVGLRIFMALVAVAFVIVRVGSFYRWPICVAWMCICVSNVIKNCIRWDERTKWNVIEICFSAALFVFWSILLLLSI